MRIPLHDQCLVADVQIVSGSGAAKCLVSFAALVLALDGGILANSATALD
ncbi:MAG: hypothetical protein U1A77_10630 [Pirellulales bacterium]